MKKILCGIVMIMCMLMVACGEQANSSTQNTEQADSEIISESASQTEIESSEAEVQPSLDEKTVEFVDRINSVGSVSLEYVEDFTPSDNTSAHYRTEYRLGAYNDAIGKSYKLGDAVIDIVARDEWSGGSVFRIYMDNGTLDQCISIVTAASPIMDETVTENDIQETVTYITDNKSANGYYYADLGLLLLGSDTKGYELMLKMKND